MKLEDIFITNLKDLKTFSKIPLSLGRGVSWSSYCTKLTFDDIVNVPVADASSVDDWNTWFDLPEGSTPYTSVTVDENVVTLEGGSDIKFKDYLFGDDACGEHILEIEDSGCVTELGEGVFSDLGSGSGCYSLTKAIFPYVTTIGQWCFAGCQALVDIDLSSLTAESFESAIWLFDYCTSLVDISKCIPQDITLIPEGTFYGCTSLTSITIPDSVTSIGDYAFCYCISLTSAIIGSGVTDIGKEVFQNCSSLTSIIIPDSVTSIGQSFFYECTSLASVTIGSGLTSIGQSFFYECTSLASITIPDSVTSIGDQAFHSCTSLETIILPERITVIEEQLFAYCTSLLGITIPSSVTSIGNAAFSNCIAFTSITIPSSVTSIGNYAFNKCSNLGTYNMYRTAAPTVNVTNSFGDYAATLHIQAGSTGYNVAPWANTAKFASIVQDL